MSEKKHKENYGSNKMTCHLNRKRHYWFRENSSIKVIRGSTLRQDDQCGICGKYRAEVEAEKKAIKSKGLRTETK